MKKHFFTGLVILAPIALTLIIVVYLFDLFTAPFAGMIETFLMTFEKTLATHRDLVLFLSRLISLVFLFFLILFLGFVARRFFFTTMLRWTNLLFLKIPFVKSVYRISKDVTKAFFSQRGKTFKRTVLIPFPNEKTYSLGFVTGDIPEPLKKLLHNLDTAVFVPTAPHPLSGYIVMTKKEEILDVDITTEEAFKFLVSCGVVQPGQPVPSEVHE
jgi:uncharacterized membrane protein